MPLIPVLTAVLRLPHLWSAGSALPSSKGALPGSPAFAASCWASSASSLHPVRVGRQHLPQAQSLLLALQLKQDAAKRESDPEVLNGPWGENARAEPLRWWRWQHLAATPHTCVSKLTAQMTVRQHGAHCLQWDSRKAKARTSKTEHAFPPRNRTLVDMASAATC